MALCSSWCISASRLSSSSCNSFFHSIYPISLSAIFFLLLSFTPKLFGFFCIWLLVCLRAFYWVEFSFIILECSVLFALAWSCLSCSLLSSKSFDFFLQVDLSAFFVLGFSSFVHICFVKTFASCRSFFTCPSTKFPSLEILLLVEVFLLVLLA